MNKVCMTGMLSKQPKPLGQSGKSAVMYVTGFVPAWDSHNRQMYQKRAVMEVICFGKSLEKLRKKFSQGVMVTVEGHLDVRENENQGRIYRNMQVVCDELTFLGYLEDGGGHGGMSDDDNAEPSAGSWDAGYRDEYNQDSGWGNDGPDDDIPF